VGLQLPKRASGVARRIAVGTMLGFGLLIVGGCSADQRGEWKRGAMPDPATTESQDILSLWQWAWVAALVTGVIVWALIFWVAWRYRRRSEDDVPVQTRYNLPLEIFYTIAPVMMVIVFFYWTVTVQNRVLDESDGADHVVKVVGQQWSWTFNYENEPAVESAYVYTAGTASQIPTLVLPVDETVKVELSSPDMIHSFWVPGFLMKMDVVPGRDNKFQFTPDRIGTFKGKCTELCGAYHSRMLFNVEVVSRADYEKHLQDLEERGFTSEEPVLGGENARVQDGVEAESNGENE